MSQQGSPRIGPVVCVGALVRGPAGYLVVRTTKWRGAWGVPGGKVEYGETLVQALKREFEEEVGLALSQVRQVQLQEAARSSEFYREAHMLLVDFLAETSSTQVTPNQEIEEWAWVTLAQALTYPLNSYTRTLVALASQQQSPAPTKAKGR